MVSGSSSRSPYLLLGAFSLSAALVGCIHPRDRVLSRPAYPDADEGAAGVFAHPSANGPMDPFMNPSVHPSTDLSANPSMNPSMDPHANSWPPAMRGPYDFLWRLSGERRAGPSQVFSTPEGVWLQFDRDSRLPAVFGSDRAGNDLLLHPVRVPPYLFVQGDWSRLVFRLGHLAAQAVKHTYFSPGETQRSAPPDTEAYRATPDDRNMRRVLKRWAQAAGWTFGVDHWTLDVDIPVSASADLGSDFTTAVRALLASTEMLDRPAQPCFYTNKVLRVIGASQQCDPRRHSAGAAYRRGVQ